MEAFLAMKQTNETTTKKQTNWRFNIYMMSIHQTKQHDELALGCGIL